MIIIYLSCFVALILLIWFKSDAFIEWGSAIGLKRLLQIDQYKEKKLSDISFPLTYPLFLRFKYNNFFIKGLTCPLCLCIWLSIIFCVFDSLVFLIPVVCISALLIYGLINKLI